MLSGGQHHRLDRPVGDSGWRLGDQTVVRPPIVARLNFSPVPGSLPPDRHRCGISQDFGIRWLSDSGSASPLPATATNAMRQTRRHSFHRRLTSAGVSDPLNCRGWIPARHRISSAIQFPIPGNRSCMSKTALIGARALRRRNAAMAATVNALERIAGAIPLHHMGAFFPS
jgi:hypothetical protein